MKVISKVTHLCRVQRNVSWCKAHKGLKLDTHRVFFFYLPLFLWILLRNNLTILDWFFIKIKCPPKRICPEEELVSEEDFLHFRDNSFLCPQKQFQNWQNTLRDSSGTIRSRLILQAGLKDNCPEEELFVVTLGPRNSVRDNYS